MNIHHFLSTKNTRERSSSQHKGPENSKTSKVFPKKADIGSWETMEVQLHNQSQSLSVMEIADICGVARSTVSYWISERSLPAHRSGKKHMVSLKDLIPFLESQGHPVPKPLWGNSDEVYHRSIRPFKPCWEYWSKDIHRKGCESCPVFTHDSLACFTAKQNPGQGCRMDCAECQYFYEYYAPAMSFIHQIKNPSAIYKDLYIWSGNRAWADLCGVDTKTLIGAGAEEFIHSESLKKIINYDKKTRMGDKSEVFRFDLVFISKDGKKTKTDLSISPLKNPDGTWLAVVERQCQS
jgi:excisionase family DNA binding protein/PAS domain S-box-containing protein